MINLLPDDTKKEIRAARANVLLVRYIMIIGFGLAFLAFILAGSYYLLNQTKANALQVIAANNVKADEYSTTKAQVDTLSTSLSDAKLLLNQEIQYSKVLVNIAQLMPAGTLIDKISLNSSSFGSTPLTLQIYAKTTTAAVALRDKFQGSPLFSNVSFESISDTSGGIQGYPVSAQMTLTITREATK